MAQNFYQPFGGFYSALQPSAPQMGVMPSPTPAMAQSAVPAAQQANFTCRPVTSREEAVAVQADFFSLGTLMPDLAHGVVYMKRINQQTGSADFFEFGYRQPEQEQKSEYVTREEFEKFVQSLQTKKKGKETESNE